MAPQVSVVVPTHNRSRLLALTMDSILGQRDVDLEVVVVDDGSTDDTAKVIDDLGDDRVRLVRHESPRGVSAARNAGIAAARGEWVGFCDDDDLWAPEKLTQQLHAAAATGRDWVCAGHVDVTPRLRVVAGGPPPATEEIARLLRYRNVVPGGGSGVIVRRAVLGRVGGFDARLHNTEDWELWLRLAGEGPPAIAAAPLVAYRLHPGNASLDHAVMLRDVELIESRHGIRASRAALYCYLGWWALRAGRRPRALLWFLQAVRHRDGMYGLREAAGDLAYWLRDTAVALPSRGRRRARPSSRQLPGPEEIRWRQQAQGWVDALVERAGKPERQSSQP